MTHNLTSQVRAYLTRISRRPPEMLLRRDLQRENTELRRLLYQVLVSLETNRELLITATDLISRFSAQARADRLAHGIHSEVLARALQDAIAYRQGKQYGTCEDCSAASSRFCPDHLAGFDAYSAYLDLALVLGIDLEGGSS
jgi:hypothetical protein